METGMKVHYKTVQAAEKKAEIEGQLNDYRQSIEEYNAKYKNRVGFKPKRVLIGYARRSEYRGIDEQVEVLENAGCGVIFKETTLSADTARGQYDHMNALLQPKDVVVVSDLTRLAWSTVNLTVLVDEFTNKGIDLMSVKDAWFNTTSVNKTRAGLAKAKQSGTKFGRALKEGADIEKAIDLYVNNVDGLPIGEIARICNVSRTTLWRRLRDRDLLNK